MPIINPTYAATISDQFTEGTGIRQSSGQFVDTSTKQLAAGSAAGQANKDPVITCVIAPSGTTSIDLTSFNDDAGRPFSLVAIEAIKFTNTAATDGNDATVGGGTNGVIGALPPLKSSARGDATIMLATPLTIDSTHKVLQITSAAGTTVRVSMLGR